MIGILIRLRVDLGGKPRLLQLAFDVVEIVDLERDRPVLPDSDMLKALRDTYSRSVGAEFMYISDPVVKRWIQQRLESVHGTGSFNVEQKRNILQQLTEAEGLAGALECLGLGVQPPTASWGSMINAGRAHLLEPNGWEPAQ